MDIKQLKTFVAVAEAQSFSTAAKVLHLSQPPVSLQIKQLEQELGVRLVERGGKREVSLTQAGRVLLAGARNAILAMERARANTLLFAEGHSGQLHIGYTDEFLYTPFTAAIVAFYTSAPDARLNFRLGMVAGILDRVSEGTLDAGFVCLPLSRPTENLVIKPCGSTEVVAVVAGSHPLARKKRIWLKDLAGYPVEYFHALDIVSPYSARVSSMFARSGITPNIVGSSDNSALTIEIAAQSNVVALMSLSSIPPGRTDLAALRLRDEMSTVELGVVYRRESENLPVLTRFLSLVQQRMAGPKGSIVPPG